MAAVQPEQPGQRSASAGLTLNLSSNNPFRNRAVSPSLHSPSSPFDSPPPRPVSRNPFLDPTKTRSLQNLRSYHTMSAAADEKKAASPTAEDLFDSLTIDDKKATVSSEDAAQPAAEEVKPALGDQPPQANRMPPPPRPDGARGPPMRRGPPGPGRENMPPPGMRRGPPPNHRPTRSQEEAFRARRMQGGGPMPFDPNRSPPRRVERRPRRNSESSLVDPDRPLTEEEKKARDARRRERGERRSRDIKDKKPTNRRMDIIDQLDATSIFGTGLFHHDGPFDALNPHRNRNGSQRAPMQAFPKDSLNNMIGGSGPLNARPDHATFMGRADDEAFKDYATGAKERSGSGSAYQDYPDTRGKGVIPVFDPMSRGSILHGDETLGLGTSTFLEGAPAARTAIQRREEERAADVSADGGIQRKKSLAQRIRSINRGPRDFNNSGRLTNPEGVYANRRSPTELPTAGSTAGERNPFFQEYETGKKGEETISVRRVDSNGGPADVKSPVSPRGNLGLERRFTADGPSGSADSQPRQPTGLLARVKSLKSGRRTRPAPAEPAHAEGSAGQAA